MSCSSKTIATEKRSDTHLSYRLWLWAQQNLMDKTPVSVIRSQTACEAEGLITEPRQWPVNWCSDHHICLIPLRCHGVWWTCSFSTGTKGIIKKIDPKAIHVEREREKQEETDTADCVQREKTCSYVKLLGCGSTKRKHCMQRYLQQVWDG